MNKKVSLLNQLLKEYKAKSTPYFLKTSILERIQNIIREFIQSGSQKLKKAAIAAMLVIGSYQGSAQFFADPVKPFYGATGTSEFNLPYLVDLDDDGDLDLFSAGYYGSFSYFENTGTANNPSYGSPQFSPFGLDSIQGILAYPTFADMDNDGDLDLITSGEYYAYGSILYFENIGSASNPNFAAPQTNPFGFQSAGNDVYITFPEAADLDGDGDIDLLLGTYDNYYTKMFVYYENTGTQQTPVFSTGLNDPFGLLGQLARFGVPRLIDIDNDGDLDLFSTDEYDSYTYKAEFAYFENTGTTFNPNFANLVYSPFGIKDTVRYIAFPAFGDVDNDGDVDMIIGEYYDPLSSLYFYENIGVDAITEQNLISLEVYPNPTTEWINIELNGNENTIEISDVNGKLVLKEQSQTNIYKRNLSFLEPGIYFIKVKGEMEAKTIKLIKK